MQMFPPLTLASNGLYLSLQGDVVRVHLVSPSQRVFHGTNDRAFFGNGLVVDPDGRDPAILREDDLVVDALHLPEDYPALPADSEWVLCRKMFVMEAYDIASSSADADGVIKQVDLTSIIDNFIIDWPRFARWREFLLASFKFLGRANV